jgi:hypothetical protein
LGSVPLMRLFTIAVGAYGDLSGLTPRPLPKR